MYRYTVYEPVRPESIAGVVEWRAPRMKSAAHFRSSFSRAYGAPASMKRTGTRKNAERIAQGMLPIRSAFVCVRRRAKPASFFLSIAGIFGSIRNKLGQPSSFGRGADVETKSPEGAKGFYALYFLSPLRGFAHAQLETPGLRRGYSLLAASGLTKEFREQKPVRATIVIRQHHGPFPISPARSCGRSRESGPHGSYFP